MLFKWQCVFSAAQTLCTFHSADILLHVNARNDDVVTEKWNTFWYFYMTRKFCVKTPSGCSENANHRCKKRFFTFFLFFQRFLFYFIFFCLTHVDLQKTKHSNSRLCIGLQLQAQKLLMITVKFRWVLRVRIILNWCLGIRHGVERSWH